MGVPSSCGTRASCSTPRTGIMRCITVAAAVISILCMSEATKCCREEIVSIAAPASMPTPPVMPLEDGPGAASAAKCRPYSFAPGVYGLMVGCASTNDLTFLSPPHVTGSGYWYRCMMMCFANALTDHEGFAPDCSRRHLA